MCLQVPLPAHVAQQPFDEVQLTLVDCPGHASLIRTIIGGAQIIDMMILVIDITKGVGRTCCGLMWSSDLLHIGFDALASNLR